MPQPDGLVGRPPVAAARGAARSSRGSGTSRPAIGCKRINWPVSLRTRELHVITTRAEQDAGVWLVVDGLRDIGVSGGIDGAASTLDLTVRAAARWPSTTSAPATGSGLLVVAADGARVRLGSGPPTPPRSCRAPWPGSAPRRGPCRPERLDLGGASAGSVVYVLSPMLFTPLVTATASLQRSGASVIVIDTLGRACDERRPARHCRSLAPRMQKIERDDRLERLAALGCPVVPWRGPGTLDTVLHQLARRARVPKVRAR